MSSLKFLNYKFKARYITMAVMVEMGHHISIAR